MEMCSVHRKYADPKENLGIHLIIPNALCCYLSPP